MPTYELIFAVDELADDTVWSIYEEFDALVATHGALTLLTVSVPGANAVRAAKSAVEELERLQGVRVKRCYEDLVSRMDIAERTEATPQAVGQWIRGTRHRDQPFPEPFNLVSGGVWLWGEVNQWLRRVGKKADDQQFPCKEDYADINKWLNERRIRLQLPRGTKATAWHRGPDVPKVHMAHGPGTRSFDWNSASEMAD